MFSVRPLSSVLAQATQAREIETLPATSVSDCFICFEIFFAKSCIGKAEEDFYSFGEATSPPCLLCADRDCTHADQLASCMHQICVTQSQT